MFCNTKSPLSYVTVQNHFGTERSVATLFRFIACFARGLITTYGHADPPTSKVSPLKKWLWMVRNVLNRTGKIIKKFPDFYFSSYHRKLGWFFQRNYTKMALRFLYANLFVFCSPKVFVCWLVCFLAVRFLYAKLFVFSSPEVFVC